VSVRAGDTAERTFHVSEQTLRDFAEACGDRNPLHFDEEFASRTRFGGRIAHGMLTGGFISAVIGNDLPGPGSVYLGQDLRFRAPVRPGDDVRCHVRVAEVDDRGRATLETRAWVGDTLVVDGTARVLIDPGPGP
jgi:3-hydroxybutyryl-CoA dehydratase